MRVDPSRDGPCTVVATFAQLWSALESSFGDRRWLIVVDRNLLRRNAAVLTGLGRARRRSVVEVTGGEALKKLSRLDPLVQAARDAGLDRSGLVVAVGGGTVGDLAGFFASVWMRGVDWVPVGTTTLSIADSAVGGKTAVDWRGIKNLLGHFHDPVAVYGVREALDTLPARHYRAGLAEVVKSALIADRSLFERLERAASDLRRRRGDTLMGFLAEASAIKARIVAADPREHGIRAHLNLGHTVGHALEATHRPRLYHGEAVAAGTIAASWLSERLVGADPGTTDRVEALLGELGLLRVLSPVRSTTLWEAMTSDKKAAQGQLRVVLTPRIGTATVSPLESRSLMRQAVLEMQRRCARGARENAR